MNISNTSKKLSGVVVPLGALYTKDNPVIGEFEDLIPFSQFCKTAGFGIIQLLPVNDTGTQSSPYSGLSAFALHPIYIRLSSIPEFSNLLAKNKKIHTDYENFLKANQYKCRYNYDEILNSKIYFLQEAYKTTEFYKTGKADKKLNEFIQKNIHWIKAYAVYKNLKWKYMQASWKSWNKEDKKNKPEEIEAFINTIWNDTEIKKDLLFYVWCQQIAAEQFEKAVAEVHKQGILLKGDMPILMNEDSCDAWSLPQFFNQDLRAGSPADGENPTGQNWGFPTYNWKSLKEQNYSWWINRLKSASQYYDAYRLDHILGFFRIWAIPDGDLNALNGHTEPYSAIKKDTLLELNFDANRIRWLSQPHIPTHVIEDITWNHEAAHKILKLLCNQIGTEELWLFKPEIQGSKTLASYDFGDLCTKEAAEKIREKLVEYWSNRTLIEIGKNKFVPMWTYGNSTSWVSLSNSEKAQLQDLFDTLNKKNEKLWKKQADEIFTAITSEISMIPCGEDLGIGIDCVPKTMKNHNILGLRVVRWCREWSEPKQPYIDFEEYEPLSVTTTSVHDSSTIRDWWEQELGTNQQFKKMQEEKSLEKTSRIKAKSSTQNDDLAENVPQKFSPETAKSIMKKCSKSASIWYINPLQDYLYMNKKYWLETAEEERINVPGSVNQFNWTYRIPASLETLLADKNLIEDINETTKRS
ncbi:MAG: 4-alpha-glucanotransferase [Treponema sp.]|nr:4-alpha-glucanotransferase [Treponema sp.]